VHEASLRFLPPILHLSIVGAHRCKGADTVTRENALSVYISLSKADARPIERLRRLSKERDRSMNYLIVEAILQYLDREEADD